MQYKKDEVKNKLVNSGEEEFFLHGFQKSSVRRIVKNAGTTIGNFYNYFSNKEALFHEVVGSELKQFDDFINGHEDSDDNESLLMINNPSELHKLINESAGIFMPVFTKRFYILVACSEGTGYSDSRVMVQEYVKTHFIGHVNDSGAGIEKPEKTADVLAYEFLEGILYIIKKYGETPTAKILIKNHMLFFLTGTIGILKGAEHDKS